jgi:DNA-binding NtrC family response regulator
MSQPDQLLRGARVLIVEDEYFIADDLARALRSCGATPVGPASTLEQAARLLDDEKVDATILDLNLHGDMAYPLTEVLSREQMPCIIISGYAGNSLPDAVKSMPRLEKPVSAVLAMSCLSKEIKRADGARRSS